MQLQEEELKTQDPSFWDDPKAAESQMKSIRGLKFWIDAYDQLKSSFDDLEVLIEFLKEGSKVRAHVFFKGRSIIYKDQGQILLLRLATDLEEFGKVEAMPVLEGKRMIMFIAPKKKK